MVFEGFLGTGTTSAILQHKANESRLINERNTMVSLEEFFLIVHFRKSEKYRVGQYHHAHLVDTEFFVHS